jgi:hypothetical protein
MVWFSSTSETYPDPRRSALAWKFFAKTHPPPAAQGANMLAMRALQILILLLIPACNIISAPEPAPGPPTLPSGDRWELSADWDSIPAQLFEKLVLEKLPDGQRTSIAREDRSVLAEALDRMDPSSVRAAVILGRSRTTSSGKILLNRLLKAEAGPENNSDAGDVTAAAALARFPKLKRYWRLVRLVNGPTPHPDLEVRVECAATALHAGMDRVIPFLLQVIRIDTPLGLQDELDFTPSERTAWARGRAAEALSIRAGMPLNFHPDASMQARQEEAQKLALLLQDAIANAEEVDYSKQ